MSEYYILDENKNIVEVDLFKWAEWFSKADRHVGLTDIAGLKVSTVFLGIDHNFGDGPPLLFETMVFGAPQDSYWYDFQMRWATYEQASKGHQNTVQIIKDEILHRPISDLDATATFI